ncbi:hypothetical protein ND856_14090 [Leptospira bandrabouensis]|uniref:hypothetical protein n=1 Tax=Leptospira bandrabouensis TaxID=2484903 RepID=UPI00223DBB39|nr:hypothetical protein [Leptospira bandrabouensis]MCW7459561.1 hypothetical protein [Leptospira bandrabouensis]MCW7478421.1 hypothetical protein [Leptospira bandrabouensis]MCW7486295.1 hypothetical protein [Leptospira bandrabouensis]
MSEEEVLRLKAEIEKLKRPMFSKNDFWRLLSVGMIFIGQHYPKLETTFGMLQGSYLGKTNEIILAGLAGFIFIPLINRWLDNKKAKQFQDQIQE